LRVLDVPKDLPDVPVPPEPGETREDMDDLAISELALEPDAVLTAEAPAAGPKAPDFRGKTMRAVAEEASSMGLGVLLDGSGIARAQHPPPGAPLPEGERIRVHFAR
jgi:hypothetical protein